MAPGGDGYRCRMMNAVSAISTNDTLWEAVLTRDAASDGRFVYAVRSTGIYCRPS